MNTEEDEFKRIETEAKRRAARDEDDDTQEYVSEFALPPQRTWVGLTDEEVTDLWHKTEPYYHEDDFARAIEAKLKEKNT